MEDRLSVPADTTYTYNVKRFLMSLILSLEKKDKQLKEFETKLKEFETKLNDLNLD